MKLCVSMWSMHRKFYDDGWTVLDFLKFCREHNILHVELLDIFWKNPSEELPVVQDYLTSNGMTVGAYAVTNDFVNDDPALRVKALQSILNGIVFAKNLNTRVVRVFAGDLKSGYDFDLAVNYIVEGLKEAATVAEKSDVILALENHGKLAGRADQVDYILRQVGSHHLKSTFDCGNFLLVSQNPLDAYEVLSSEIGHVHVKDFIRSQNGQGLLGTDGFHYEGVACGEGQVPLAEIVKKLSARNYEGYVAVEFEGSGDETVGVLNSYTFLYSLQETARA